MKYSIRKIIAICVFAASSQVVLADNILVEQQPSTTVVTSTEEKLLSIRELVEIAVELLGSPDAVFEDIPVETTDTQSAKQFPDSDLDGISDWLKNSTTPTQEPITVEDDSSRLQERYETLAHITDVLADLALTEPLHALAIAQNAILPEELSSLTHNVLMAWGDNAPADAFDWVLQTDDLTLLEEYSATVLYQWMPIDPEAASAALERLPTSQDKSYFKAQYASTIASTDPYRAYQWASSLGNSDERKMSLEWVAQQWAYSDTEGFLSFIEGDASEESTVLLTQNIATIADRKSATDPLNTLIWADSLQDHDRSIARQVTFESWYYQYPEDALIQSQLLLDESEHQQFIQSVAHTLPTQNFEYAMSVFDTADDSTRSNLAFSLMRTMVEKNEDQAIQWFNQLPADHDEQNTRESALYGLVETLAINQPQEAFTILHQYTGKNQNEIIANGFWSIAVHHPAIAQQLIEQSELTADQRSTFTEILDTALDTRSYGGC